MSSLVRDVAKHRWIGFGPFLPTMTGFRAIFESAGLELTLAELRSNRYLAVVPKELVRSQVSSGELAELPLKLEPKAGWNISIVRRADRPVSSAAAALIECVKEAA